jgi:hypothetical protein
MEGPRYFLLSPAHCGGRRARILFNGGADFPLAVRLRAGEATLGEAFSFLSGLYFRGKLAYATRFGSGNGGVQVITTNRGLLSPETVVTVDELRAFGQVDIDLADARYRAPLERDVAELARRAPRQVVLLGSIATTKYLEILVAGFGDRLVYPTEFVGLGDMSRGSILLRAARAGIELRYGNAGS